jgi:hypothetical protein
MKRVIFILIVSSALMYNHSLVGQNWFTTGNAVLPGQFLGSTNTMPLDIHTDNAFLLRVNPIGLTNINGSMVQTNGYVGINTPEPRSYLHINGPNNSGFPGGGYRRWMQTGVFNLENSDNLFTGLLPMGLNRSDAVWVWGDDSSGEPTNYSRFIFTGAAGVDGSCTDCPTNSTGREGREVMRLAPNGRVGVGPLFETNPGGINSNIHNHMEGTLPVWFQQSNETGTGGAATDGLRIGITSNSNAYMFNQENNPLIFSTGNTTSQLTRERFRITHIGVPGMPNNGGYPDNFTRIGISLNPLSPVSLPRSLIHMGTNVAEIGPSTQGWRPWMNTGVYMNEQLDNMYVGLKFEGTQRADAVVAWGANQTVEDGQDNLRFIFARSALSGGGDAESVSIDGLEVGRFAPTGNFGIGNFYTNGLNEQPTQKLDVDGTARLRQMPSDPPNALITGVQVTGAGDYVLNYLEFSQDPNEVLNGEGDWVNISGALCDWNIVNGGADVAMGYPGACVDRATGIGTDTPESKLEVDFSGNLPVGFNDIAVDATIATYNEGNSFNRIAVRGIARNDYEELIFNQYGGYFSGYGGRFTYGVFGDALRSPYLNQNTENAGVYGRSQDVSEAGQNIGVKGFAQNSKFNYGVRGDALYDSGMGGAQPDYNYGVYGKACLASQRNYGVYGTICQGSPGYAGYFDGALYATSGPWGPSDASLKQNIEPFENALDIISQLQPKTYEFIPDINSEINLPQGSQIGLISQELEEVLPNLVRSTVHPGSNDEEGNVIHSELEFKAVNYTGLIPVLIAGMKEQQAIIESQNEVLAQMMEQLANMQQQINDCCNSGDGNRSMPTGVIQPQDFNNQKSVEGGNELFQNIPNPFRESTTISYMLEEGGRVQLSVYDANGKVITTLVDARQDSGRHSTVWNANGMPAGVYHYALYVDGELLVKRAIKLQE